MDFESDFFNKFLKDTTNRSSERDLGSSDEAVTVEPNKVSGALITGIFRSIDIYDWFIYIYMLYIYICITIVIYYIIIITMMVTALLPINNY